MKKVLKWIGIGLATIVGLLIVAAGVMIASGTARLNKTYDVQPAAIAIPDDEAAIARGNYLVSAGCTGCHAEDLGGTVFVDDPALGYFPASNLTGGPGGVGATFTDADFVRAIRHGLRPDGTPLFIMPSGAFYYFSDEDLGAIISYLKSVAPVDNDLGVKAPKPMGKILLAMGAFGDVLHAETIDHSGPRPSAPAPGVTADYGEYLVNTVGDCRSCHGDALSGGQPGEPGAPFAPNLTPGDHLAKWSADDFLTLMHTGVSPDGHEIDGAFMPWERIGRMTDDDLTAIFKYLEALPALETAQ